MRPDIWPGIGLGCRDNARTGAENAVLVVFGRHEQDRKEKVADKPGMSLGAREVIIITQ